MLIELPIKVVDKSSRGKYYINAFRRVKSVAEFLRDI